MRLELSPTPETRALLERLALGRGLIVSEGRQHGQANLTAIVTALAEEEAAREAERPTLAALAKEDGDRARRYVLAALELTDGNAEAARGVLGDVLGRPGAISERDWRTSVAALELQTEIVARWPKRRGGNHAAKEQE